MLVKGLMYKIWKLQNATKDVGEATLIVKLET